MSKHDFMKAQTHVLSVNISCKCNGCERKVQKLLRKINGVHATSIDAEQGKVTVTGNVDPDVLIRELNKSGKHAEICGSQKGISAFNNKNTGQFDVVSNQLKNLPQMGKNDKKKPEVKGEKEPQKQTTIQQLIQERKAPKDLNPPVNVKDDDDDDFADDDDLDGDDEGFDDVEHDGKQPQHQKKAVHVMVTGEKAAGKATRGKRMMSMMGKAIGGKSEGKIGNPGKIKGGGGEGKIVNKGGGGGFPDFEVTNGHSAGKLPSAQGLAAAPMVSVNGGGGGGPGFGVGPMGPVPGPYQQPMNPMMNRQGMMNGGDMHHPGMYGPPPPAYDFTPPPVYHDPVTNMFSDENPESCSVM